MGAGEIALIVALISILLLARQFPKSGQAMKDLSDQGRYFWSAVALVVCSVLAFALIHSLRK
jgi:hypothetical protein